MCNLEFFISLIKNIYPHNDEEIFLETPISKNTTKKKNNNKNKIYNFI